MIFTGIDYSLTSPSICTYNTEDGDFTFGACKIIVQTDVKVTNKKSNIIFIKHPPWHDPNERYHNIWTGFCGSLLKSNVIIIEDYAFAAKGKVFHIAENTEVLQYNLWKNGKDYAKIAPTTLKRWATGKGTATKEIMYESYLKIPENPELRYISGSKSKKILSPISDIVDSYFLCKYAYENYK